MNKLRLTILLAVLCFGLNSPFAQLNMSLVSNLDYTDILNDIWGWVDSEGNEYALVGTTEGFSVVSLEDPANPEELAFIPGQSTVWRDIKTWGNFAYVVSDNTSEGMLIVDLTTVRDSVEFRYWAEDVGGIGRLRNSHNIYMDEYGLAYLAGSNLGGIIIFDVKEDPWNPAFTLKINSPYAHDVYARDSLVYTSEIYEGEFAIYDISDLDNVEALGRAGTPFQFTHNAWLSDDSGALFTTDERSNAFVGSYDISDPRNIRELDRFRPAATEGLGVIPHNVHVWDDYLVISYYVDGCIIVDASRPDNLIEVGSFDTYVNDPSESNSFNGSWGAYPFLPSGLVLMSDRQNGLFVLEPNYVRGCYLNANVIDDETGQPILNARVEIQSDEIITPDFTNLAGNVQMGKAVPGNFIVHASSPGYFSEGVNAAFVNGEQTDVTIRLLRRPTYTVRGRVIDGATGEAVPGANIALSDDIFTYDAVADADGIFTIEGAFESTYRLYAGLFDKFLITELVVEGDVDEELVVNPGFYDDFKFDYGWQISGTSTGASWVKDVPILEQYRGVACNPAADIQDDFGDEAFVTGNLGGDADDNSVEGGFTLLSSPMMDLRNWESPVLAYRAWLCVRFAAIDAFYILATNGQDTVRLGAIEPDGTGGFWRDRVEVAFPDTFDLTRLVQVHFLAENQIPENVVKAGLDAFELFDMTSTSTRDFDALSEGFSVEIFPNPGNEVLNLALNTEIAIKAPQELMVTDMLGHTVLSRRLPDQWENQQIAHDLTAGLYIVTLWRDGEQVYSGKYIVH